MGQFKSQEIGVQYEENTLTADLAEKARIFIDGDRCSVVPTPEGDERKYKKKCICLPGNRKLKIQEEIFRWTKGSSSSTVCGHHLFSSSQCTRHF